MTHHLKLSEVHLDKGSHVIDPKRGCAMDWFSVWTGQREPTNKTDAPTQCSAVIRRFVIALNDGLPDEPRQRIKDFYPAMLGTDTDGADAARGLLCANWLIRTAAPHWLRAAGLTAEADKLAALPEPTAWAAGAAGAARAARAAEAARAAGAAGAARAAEAARAARAARAAEAARAARAAGAAEAARAARAAEAAVRDCAYAIAYGAVKPGMTAKQAAAAATEALAPIVAASTDSAFELLGRMCDAGKVAVTA